MSASVYRFILQNILLGSVSLLSYANVSNADTPLERESIRFCAGSHEWPPYYHFKRVDGVKSSEVVGFDIALFNRIFQDQNIQYTAELIPWKRCLSLGMKGQKYDVVFGGGLNASRRANYVTTTGYYSVTPQYFYSNRNFPDGVSVGTQSDLKNYGRLCGLKGFNYVNFGQSNDGIDRGSKNYNQLIVKTLKGRCMVSFTRREILVGWQKVLNEKWLENLDLQFKPVPNTPQESFHLMISKNYKYAKELKKHFDTEIEKMKISGEFKKLLSQYTSSN